MTHNLELVPELTDAEAHDRAQEQHIADQRAEIRTLNARIDALATERDALQTELEDLYGMGRAAKRGSMLERQLAASLLVEKLTTVPRPPCGLCGGTGLVAPTPFDDAEDCPECAS